jgi:SAM-dependent methyltransferase
MHKRVTNFIQGIKQLHPDFFRYVNVLDCGSLDINGNNRGFFEDSKYTGIDIVDGRNVDILTKVHEYHPGKLFDVVISTEMLEHDANMMSSMANMFELLRPGGLLILTAAGFGREEHGTTDHHPKDSPLTHDYYRNIEASDFAIGLPLYRFLTWHISQLETDIRFYGIKQP